MKHAKPVDLADIEPLLMKIRSVNNLKEKQIGHFYFRGVNIVHFHIDGSRIFIDIGDSRTEIVSTHNLKEMDDILVNIGKYMHEVSLRKK